MPCGRSTLGCEAQSLQVMQWVRLETGGLSPGQVALNTPSWLVRAASSDCGVQSLQPVLRCRAISKPSAAYCWACSAVIAVSGYMYDVARGHSQSATEQPGF